MSEAHTNRAHAKLSPSSAHRWMNCPGSVRMSEGIPNTSSVYAAEGTAAHELAAYCLQEGWAPATFEGMWVDVTNGKIVDTPADTDEEHRFFEITEEMVEAVHTYVEYVSELVHRPDADETFHELPILEVEQRLDMTHLHPEIFGTGDATVYDPIARHLDVIDFKYGKGVAVEATANPQLLLYAAGAARRHHNVQIETLTVHIVQPRASHPDGRIRSYPIDLIGLFEFEDELAEAAARTDDPDAPVVSGEWCRFCPASGICPIHRERILSVAAAEFGDVGSEIRLTPPDQLEPERLGVLLREADQIGNYVKAVQEYAHAQALAGNIPSGFKLVAKRATRKWKDEDEALKFLRGRKVSDDDLFTEPKLKSPAQLEKFFPGKNKTERQAAMQDLVESKSSGLNLAPVEDPRPAVAVDAASEFGAVE